MLLNIIVISGDIQTYKCSLSQITCVQIRALFIINIIIIRHQLSDNLVTN